MRGRRWGLRGELWGIRFYKQLICMFEKEIKKLQEVLEISKACNGNELYWVEFKTNFVDENSKLKLFGQNISGIANSCTYYKRNFGYIICGIKDQTLVEKGVDFDLFNMEIGSSSLELNLR
jgi:predicted HTH transcriptional regulator